MKTNDAIRIVSSTLGLGFGLICRANIVVDCSIYRGYELMRHPPQIQYNIYTICYIVCMCEAPKGIFH